MKNGIKKPSLLFAILSNLVFFLGLLLMAGEYENSQYVLYAGLIMGAIFWVWSIIEVGGTDEIKKYQKTFWLIIVISIPMFGALLYAIMHQRRNKIAA